MFDLFFSPAGRPVTVYNVRDDIVGYPQFLVYDSGRWLYISAKHFAPLSETDTESQSERG